MWPGKNKRSSLTSEERIARENELTANLKNYFLVGPPCLNQTQIDHLKSLLKAQSGSADVVGYGYQGADKTIRRTRGCSIENNETSGWLYEIIRQAFSSANEILRYDVMMDMIEPIQLLRYDAEEQGYFAWHTDTHPADMTRKLSLVIPLSDPSDYEGGKLQFLQGSAFSEIDQVAGVPVIFPGWLIHQVTPVTKGSRCSLTAWIKGPNWR